MRKVGLAVVTYKDNFGSALQTYATQTVINRFGYETGIFDISRLQKSIKMRKIFYYLSRMFYSDERKYVFNNAKSSAKKNATGGYADNMKTRHMMYTAFYEKELSFLPQAQNWGDLKKQSSACSSVVVGSDQLWGPANIAAKYFTLEFVPDEINKIAYSTSFGVSVLPRQLYRHAKKYLSRINHISVRETSGKTIVKEVTNVEVPVVCDPTMLLSPQEWMSIQEDVPFTDGKYILVYLMGNNPEQRVFVKNLKEKTGYKIVGLLHGSVYLESDEGYCDETPYNVGPGEFLNLIRNASYVCTDSFHCCVFSILYEKNFFAFRRENDNSAFNTNDRLYTLLKWTNLMERIKTGDEEITDSILLDVNYIGISDKIECRRTEGLNYLKDALEG